MKFSMVGITGEGVPDGIGMYFRSYFVNTHWYWFRMLASSAAARWISSLILTETQPVLSFHRHDGTPRVFLVVPLGWNIII